MNRQLSVTLTYWHIITFFIGIIITASVWAEKVNSQIGELPNRVAITEDKLAKQDTSLVRIETSLSFVQNSNIQMQKDLNDIRTYLLSK